MKKVPVVISMTYGATKDGLMLPTLEVLLKATTYALRNPESLLICLSEDHPSLGVRAQEGWPYRRSLVIPIQHVRMAVVVNSISEPGSVAEILKEEGVEPSSLTLFCDKSHAMRVGPIWRHFFPNVPIELMKNKCTWTSAQPYKSQRGPFRWWLANVIGLVMMKVLGIERMKNLKQSS